MKEGIRKAWLEKQLKRVSDNVTERTAQSRRYFRE